MRKLGTPLFLAIHLESAKASTPANHATVITARIPF
jgi:hypothetical protein